ARLGGAGRLLRRAGLLLGGRRRRTGHHGQGPRVQAGRQGRGQEQGQEPGGLTLHRAPPEPADLELLGLEFEQDPTPPPPPRRRRDGRTRLLLGVGAAVLLAVLYMAATRSAAAGLDRKWQAVLGADRDRQGQLARLGDPTASFQVWTSV